MLVGLAPIRRRIPSPGGRQRTAEMDHRRRRDLEVREISFDVSGISGMLNLLLF